MLGCGVGASSNQTLDWQRRGQQSHHVTPQFIFPSKFRLGLHSAIWWHKFKLCANATIYSSLEGTKCLSILSLILQ